MSCLHASAVHLNISCQNLSACRFERQNKLTYLHFALLLMSNVYKYFVSNTGDISVDCAGGSIHPGS